MIYVKKLTDTTADIKPISEKELRAILSNTILPSIITNKDIEPLGYIAVDTTDILPSDSYTHRIDLISIDKIDGKWIRTYGLVEVPEYVRDRRLTNKWKAIRHIRDTKMKEYDWKVLRASRLSHISGDTSYIDNAHSYMQALADITNQPDPFNIVWPVEPNV